MMRLDYLPDRVFKTFLNTGCLLVMPRKVSRLNVWFKLSIMRLVSKVLRLQQARPLTAGEKKLINSVFYNQIDLERPRICASGWVIKGYAISPNGHIYFNPSDFLQDFSLAPLGKQAWFIHEMTHVWQIQYGMSVVRRAMVDRRYKYLLEQGKSFFAYGIEQQAQMVQDFFVQRSLGQDCQALAECLPFSNGTSKNSSLV